MQRPFRNIEMQTTGVHIDNPMLRFMRNHVGINTIALSLFSFDDAENQECRGSRLQLDIAEFCKQVKVYDFNLRLCINLTKYHDDIGNPATTTPGKLFELAKGLGADQVTLRRLYDANGGSCQSKWVKENSLDTKAYNLLRLYVQDAPELRRLEYG
jgi:hypothetical protein